MVIRITPASTINFYVLANSRPCIACLYRIKNTINFGYRITKVYYSNENGEIVCYKLRDIVNEKQMLSKYYRKLAIPKKYFNEFEIVNTDKNKIQKC